MWRRSNITEAEPIYRISWTLEPAQGIQDRGPAYLELRGQVRTAQALAGLVPARHDPFAQIREILAQKAP